ncbi:MAG: hypothetical protein ACRDHP_15745 [Ktedonobacterales bacterium]
MLYPLVTTYAPDDSRALPGPDGRRKQCERSASPSECDGHARAPRATGDFIIPAHFAGLKKNSSSTYADPMWFFVGTAYDMRVRMGTPAQRGDDERSEQWQQRRFG